MTIEEMQVTAFNVMALPTPKKFTQAERNAIPNSAIFKYWLTNKDVGTPMTREQPMDDGTTALITTTGKILHWVGGDNVEVL